jgi:hypothetical protein
MKVRSPTKRRLTSADRFAGRIEQGRAGDGEMFAARAVESLIQQPVMSKP